MSCGCQIPKGSFAPEDQTWTRASSLSMQSWDPYPELQNPNNCYGNRESYTGASMRRENFNYQVGNKQMDTGTNANWAPFVPNLNRSIIVAENYGNNLPCCRTTPYNKLEQTWGAQQNYSL